LEVSTERALNAVDKLLGSIDAFFTSFHVKRFDLLENGLIQHSEAISAAMRQLRRARQEFDAHLFIVTAFGPLKSGKSTFINSVARAKVSPTQYGRECTLNPSIIIQDDHPGIEQYFSKLPYDDDNELFNLVIDYLRGMATIADLEAKIRVEHTPLTEDEVYNKLSRHYVQAERPIITVIKAPGGNLLRKGVAFLDMPGLDGSISNWRDDPLHEWVAERTDFVLFIQSSMAAVNMESIEFLRHLVAKRPQLPVWLVQNIIEARNWRPPEEIDRETQMQMEYTARHIRECLGRNRDLPQMVVNLGKAGDSIFDRNYAHMFEESGLDRLETRLKEIFEQSKNSIKLKNNMEGVCRRLQEIAKICRLALSTLRESEGLYNENLKNFDDCQRKIAQIKYAAEIKNLNESVARYAHEQAAAWIKRLGLEIEKKIEQLNHAIPRKEANEHLAKLAATIGSLGQQLFFAPRGIFGQRIGELTASSLEAGEKAAALSEVDKFLESIELESLPSVMSTVRKTPLPGIVDTPLSYDQVKLSFLDNIITRRLDGAEMQTYLLDAHKSFTIDIETRAGQWVVYYTEVYLNDVLDRRAKDLSAHIERQKRVYMDRLAEEMQRIQEAKHLINSLMEDLAGLDPLVQEAMASLRRGD